MLHENGGTSSSFHRFLFVALLTGVTAAAACNRGPSLTATVPNITLTVPADRVQPAFVEVSGLSSAELVDLRVARLAVDQWQSLLEITVDGVSITDSVPAVQGGYEITDTSLKFTPLFPFDPGRTYRVVFDPARLPSPRQAAQVTARVGLPPVATEPSTIVTGMHPSADVVPENLLRIYIDFSAPMGNGVARGFVHIKDEAGREVAIPFLPVDADFWNPEHTRCTVFFDPGRVKDNILPNRQIGRPLRAGHKYTLEVSTDWHDAQGQPLKTVFRKSFRVGPADERPMTMRSWKIATPKAGTRDPLVVTFPKPLDHGLLARTIGVQTRDKRPLDGDVTLEANDTRWLFRPLAPWPGGEYDLVALGILEDPAGNRIESAFEMPSGKNQSPTSPDQFRAPFTIGPAKDK